jgi:hypothetical protein
VDERRLAWPYTDESEGGGRKEGTTCRSAFLKRRQGRGEGPKVRCHVEERTDREGGAGEEREKGEGGGDR